MISIEVQTVQHGMHKLQYCDHCNDPNYDVILHWLLQQQHLLQKKKLGDLPTHIYNITGNKTKDK